MKTPRQRELVSIAPSVTRTSSPRPLAVNAPTTDASKGQPRSQAIAINPSNKTPSAQAPPPPPPPQAEPFYRPKHLPIATPSNAPHSASNDPLSQSLPNNFQKPSDSNPFVPLPSITDASDKQPEEPRTPHSRAKNVARFYPVTKDAPVVTTDVRKLVAGDAWTVRMHML